MPQQTLAQSRMIDPIATTHAQGYVRPDTSWRVLFPPVNVGAYGGQVIEFGKEAFRRYNTKRSPGAATKRITFGYAGKPYAIVPSALEALVPFENMVDARAVPGLDLAADSIDIVLDALDLDTEYEAAGIARNASNYDSNHKLALTSTARWKGSAGDPNKDIEAATQAVRASVGIRANTVLLSPSAFSAAKQNGKVIEAIKYTQRGIVTTALLAELWDVQTVAVAGAIGATGQTDVLADVWGDDVIVAYVAPAAGGNKRSAARPSYGYTYQIAGMPSVRAPYQDENANSWVYQVAADRTPVASGLTAAFLLQNAGASPS